MNNTNPKVVCVTTKVQDILRYPEGKTISNGKIIPVVCIIYRTCYNSNGQNASVPNPVVTEENRDRDTDYYGWKNKKIKVRKFLHIRRDNKETVNPGNYDDLTYSFYYLEYD